MSVALYLVDQTLRLTNQKHASGNKSQGRIARPVSIRRRRGFVAKLCTQCGKPLPRDDARFCNNCGTHIAPAPPGSTLASPRPRVVAPEGQRPSDPGSRSALREQIAFPPRPTRIESPSWMRKLESG